MSYREERLMSLAGLDINKLSVKELKTYCKKILKGKIHGICFSVYDENQEPGSKISDNQILEKLEINPEREDVILNQIVSLKSNDKTVKFSKRSGNSIFLSEIVEEIGADACRFSFLSRSSESQMEIDLDLFKSKSSENPVFYIQYAHARLCSILKKANEQHVDFET